MRQRRRRYLVIGYGAVIALVILFGVLAATMAKGTTPEIATTTAIRAKPTANSEGIDATATTLAATSDTLSTASQRLIATSDAFIHRRETTSTAGAP